MKSILRWNNCFICLVLFLHNSLRTLRTANAKPSNGPHRSVRPIFSRKTNEGPDVANGGSNAAKSYRRPFLSSPINSRRAAQKAYLLLLEKELHTTQRQLYTSQNKCTELRKRWENQRRETLGLLGLGSHKSGVDASTEKQTLDSQEEDIQKLKIQLETETKNFEKQTEQILLLQSELEENRLWRKQQEQIASEAKEDEDQLLQYKEELTHSNQKLSQYEKELQMLTLKLEAAEFAASQATAKKEDQLGQIGKGDIWENRANELNSRLKSLRKTYSDLLREISDTNVLEGAITEQGSKEQQRLQIEEQLDSALQSVVLSSIEQIEREWSLKYEKLQHQLEDATNYTTIVEEERNTALRQLKETYMHQKSSGLTQKEEKSLKESLKKELSTDLTKQITEELTETLTEQLTEQLQKTITEKIERKYRKKYGKLLKQQQQENTSTPQHQQIIDDSIEKIRKQYEVEYEAKLERVQRQSEEQVQLQKERMRKLVRALLEREAKQKSQAISENSQVDIKENIRDKKRGGADVGGIKSETTHRQRKKKKKSMENSENENTNAGHDDDGGIKSSRSIVDENDEVIRASFSSTAAIPSSKKKNRSRSGVTPVRGNASATSRIS